MAEDFFYNVDREYEFMEEICIPYLGKYGKKLHFDLLTIGIVWVLQL